MENALKKLLCAAWLALATALAAAAPAFGATLSSLIEQPLSSVELRYRRSKDFHPPRALVELRVTVRLVRARIEQRPGIARRRRHDR